MNLTGTCKDCPCYQVRHDREKPYSWGIHDGECRLRGPNTWKQPFPLVRKSDWCYEGRKLMARKQISEKLSCHLPHDRISDILVSDILEFFKISKEISHDNKS